MISSKFKLKMSIENIWLYILYFLYFMFQYELGTSEKYFITFLNLKYNNKHCNEFLAMKYLFF